MPGRGAGRRRAVAGRHARGGGGKRFKQGLALIDPRQKHCANGEFSSVT